MSHTHPLYKDATVNRVNKYFSVGAAYVLFPKGIPTYLRTPKSREIKVLEIREKWVTTCKVSLQKRIRLNAVVRSHEH